MIYEYQKYLFLMKEGNSIFMFYYFIDVKQSKFTYYSSKNLAPGLIFYLSPPLREGVGV